MKKILFVAFSLISLIGIAQDIQEKIVESRARELYRVLTLTKIEDYKKFMRENYTKALLEKPVKLNRQVSDSDAEGSTNSKSLDNLEAKAQMYAQLHRDFEGSRITSLKRTDNKVEMVLKNDDGLKGTFTLIFEKTAPYLIESLGIQADMEN